MRFSTVGLCLLLFGAPYAVQVTADGYPTSSRATWIQLGDEVVTANRGAIRAFVPTGSLLNPCLVTLADTNHTLFTPTGFAGALQTFCGVRQLNGQNGVLISIFPPQGFEPGLYLSLTVWQQGARYYGTPVLYSGD